ncbi:hypothetical protein TWF703_009584 [Orbilia oligospora]|uniref:Uncharacterized protein n=1 Tax=Orbilia oligospora TaxID=2813651 RepID=A0A7C8P471_ORBOL|nr:hypothetical protein TWF703_009584 [Orbilia oligospora]
MSISNQALQKAGPTRDRDPGHPVPAAAGGGQVTNHIKAARHSHDTAYGVGTEFTASFYQSLRRRRENVSHLGDHLIHLSWANMGHRFIQEDTSKVKKRLETERNTLEEDIKGLKKRQTYLETTYSNASDHMNKILNRSG